MENGQDFNTFIMQCARAFGAFVEMRDEPLDAPIPEKLTPASHYEDSVKKAIQRGSDLMSMTPTEQLEFGMKERVEYIERTKGYLEKNRRENANLDAMNEKVKAWQPPTKAHIELKNFMLQQISISRSIGDYWKKELEQAEKKEPLTYWSEAVAQATKDVTYYREQRDKELARFYERNEWIAQLRNSLKEVEVSI